MAGGIDAAGKPFGDGAEPRFVRVRSGLSVARDSRKDDFRIERTELVVTQSPSLQRSGPEIFDDDIGRPREPFNDFDAEGRAQIGRHASLVAIQDFVIQANAVFVRTPKANFIAAIRTFDLHDVRAVVSEKHRDHWARKETRHIQDSEAG